jgi:hypothetical protein
MAGYLLVAGVDTDLRVASWPFAGRKLVSWNAQPPR